MNAGLYRLDYVIQHPSSKQAGAITVDGDTGRVRDGAWTGEPGTVIVTDGALLDSILATYLRAHGYGRLLVPVKPPESVCPVDGTAGCRTLEWARPQVADWMRDHPLLATAGLVPGEVTDTGRVTDERAWHVIVVCGEQGIDWRQGARVRVGYAALPYYDVWRSAPYPDPQIPHAEPSQPRPDVDTPRVVRDWFHREVAAGRLVITLPAAPLPAPEARRRLREAAGLSRQAVAELLGVSRELVRKWELGELEPQEPQRAAYAELLAAWSAAQAAAVEPAAPAQEPEDSEPEAEPGVPVSDPQRHPGAQPGRALAMSPQRRAAAYARQRAERAAQGSG